MIVFAVYKSTTLIPLSELSSDFNKEFTGARSHMMKEVYLRDSLQIPPFDLKDPIKIRLLTPLSLYRLP